MKIGNVELKNAIALAPMAGVTDLPFRLLCKEQGCGLMYTEMVSAKALLYKNRNTKPLLETRPEEEPVAVQLFGSDPEIMSEMALVEAEENDYLFDEIGSALKIKQYQAEKRELLESLELYYKVKVLGIPADELLDDEQMERYQED